MIINLNGQSADLGVVVDQFAGIVDRPIKSCHTGTLQNPEGQSIEIAVVRLAQSSRPEIDYIVVKEGSAVQVYGFRVTPERLDRLKEELRNPASKYPR